MTDGPELLRIGLNGVVPVQWSVEKSDDPGSLTGWASVYNVVDQQDDVVVPGAFRKTIADWRASKRVIPLTLDHQNTAEGVIGSLAKADDTAYGLKTTFRFSSTQKAQDTRVKAREGHLNGLSIWGPIFDRTFDTVAGKSVRVLREVGLAFVGLTPIPANTDSLVLTAKAVSNTPWSQFSQTDYTDEQWARACLIDTGQGEGKQRFKLPVREPSGTLNRNGVHAAASRLNQVDAPAEKRATAARALIRMYGDMDEEAPESIRRMAGVRAASLSLPEDWEQDVRSALAITSPFARKAALDLLVADQYGLSTAISGDEPVVENEEHNIEETVDAAAYALDIAGMTGPDIPPGGGPSDSLADPLASLDAEKIKSEIDALAAEIEKEE